ncbi:Chitin synthase 8 [Smittium culicis]|uniref:chitin synthase n=1 Tax=Smittium culicis TaxID=133412 RepID=A0A1R1XPY5_9FUNG|nr:Chitin synthase 8 [Smittium culicis]
MDNSHTYVDGSPVKNFYNLNKIKDASTINVEKLAKHILDTIEAYSGTYFSVGSQVLLSIDTSRDNPSFQNPDIASAYYEYLIAGNSPKNQRINIDEPHIYKLINNAYNHMLFSNQSQSVIFLGHAASGKSVNKLDSIFMLNIMNPGQQEFFDKLNASNKVLDYFTTSRIDKFNVASSRTNTILDIFFDSAGSPIGSKTTILSIESNRFRDNPKSTLNKSPFLPTLNKLGNSNSPQNSPTSNDFPIFQIIDLFKDICSSHFTSLRLDPNFDSNDSSSSPGILDFSDLSSIGNQELIDLQLLMKSFGISNKLSSKVFTLLSAIVNLSSIDFVKSSSQNNVEPVSIPNGLAESLEFVRSNSHLSDLLTTSRSNINNSRVVTNLSVDASINKKLDLCWILYRQLVYWIVDSINNSLSTSDESLSFSLIDTIGSNSVSSDFDLLSINFFNDRLINFMTYEIFQSNNIEYTKEKIDFIPIINPNSDNKSRLDLYLNPNAGLFSIIESNSSLITSSIYEKKRNFSSSRSSISNSSSFYSTNFSQSDSKFFLDLKNILDIDSSHYFGFAKKSNSFEISHFFGKSEYSASNLCRSNVLESKTFLDEEYLQLLTSSNEKSFVSALFSSPENDEPNTMCVTVSKLAQNANKLISHIESSKTWFVVCLLTNINNSSLSLSNKYLISQLKSYDMDLVVRRKRAEFFISFDFDQFIELFHHKSDDDKFIKQLKFHLKYGHQDFFIGKSKVFLSSECFNNLVYLFNNNLLDLDKVINDEDLSRLSHIDKDNYEQNSNKKNNKVSSDFDSNIQLKSQSKVEKNQTPIFKKSKPKKSGMRKIWLFIVYSLTFYIPIFLVSIFTGIKDKQRLMAWREKVALCIIILLSCVFVIFWIGILGLLICPKQNIYSLPELFGHNTEGDALIAIRGEVFNVNKYQHNGVTFKQLLDNNYLGRDLSNTFPLQLSYVCSGLNVDPRLSMQDKPILYSDTYYHDHRWYRHYNDKNGFNYYQYNVMRVLRSGHAHGRIGFDPKNLLVSSVANPKDNVYRSIINGQVFDLSSYINANGAPYIVTPDGISNDTNTIPTEARNFLSSTVRTMFQQNQGKDISDIWSKYLESNPNEAKINHNCLRGAFYIGDVDLRKSFRCYFANYMLLAGSIFIVSMIFVKFIASIRIGNKKVNPELFESFVICNVPCYTENEESLKGTIDSIARMTYDDKRKLICIICDGIVMGSGNDKPTPNILFDILNIANVDSEPLSYFSLGENNKQHNMAQIYSGLYEVSGHTVPYLLIVKCGTPGESLKRGNRGKRDSQILLMRFLNKVFFDLPMTPLELEIFHQMKNVIGVDPSMYEYILMIDADTISSRMGLSYLLSAMQNDSKIMGACGETQIANPKESWTSMLQVYEYFIAHFMAKSFESLFGTVTCLPGCFCLYRIKSNNGQMPLLISNTVVQEYSTNKAVTLHEKNLLLLGEDRYLTTLMLKNFPNYKTKFVGYANCKTNVPQNWRILLSQRRRWINSTVHNLFELILLPNMCGFCCFSMRFVVFIDLISTVIMPATMAYLAILVYQLTNTATSYISLYLLVAIYALQAFVFILHKQWQHIGWMIIYLIAIPLFSFMIPVYSFWHFDDFSWGNTRKISNTDDDDSSGGKNNFENFEMTTFDPKSIPMRKWSDYEKELLFEMNSEAFNARSQTSQSVNSRSGAQSRAATAMSYNHMAGMQVGGPAPQFHMGQMGMGGGYPAHMSPVPQFATNFSSIPSAPVSLHNGGVPMHMMNTVDPSSIRSSYNPNRLSTYSQGFQMGQNPQINNIRASNMQMGPNTQMNNMQMNPTNQMNNMNMPTNQVIYQHQRTSPTPINNEQNNGMYHLGLNNAGSQPAVSNFVNDENAFVANLSAYMQNSTSIASYNSNAPLLSHNQQNFSPQKQQQPSPNQNQSRQQQSGNENAGSTTFSDDGSNWPSGASDKMITDITLDLLNQNGTLELSKREIRNMISQRANMSPEEIKMRKAVINNAILEFINYHNAQQ